jgi:ABC-2 type transport system permease protein
MKQLRKLFEANFKSTFREKQVWFWSVFYPVMLLVIFLMIFGKSADDSGTSFSAKIAVVAEQQNEFTGQMFTSLKQIPVLKLKDENTVTKQQAEDWLKSKDIDAAIILPSSAVNQQIGLILNKEKENSTLQQAMNGILGGFITQVNYTQANIKPTLGLNTEYVTIGSSKLKYVDFLLTGMIALAISQAGMFGMVGMVEMRRNGLLKRLMLTPVNMRMYGLSSMLVRFLLSVIQIVLLTLIGILFYKATLDVNILSFILIFIVGTMAFTGIGFLIASLSKSMESYMGIANLLSFIMMFISGIFFDTTNLPEYIKPIANVMPLKYFADGIRDGMVYGLGIGRTEFWVNLGILAAWGLVAFLIGSKLYKWKSEVK